MLLSTNLLDYCNKNGFDCGQYLDEIRRIGDICAIRHDKKGNPFRRNYERAMLLMAVASVHKCRKVLEFGTGRGFASACLSLLPAVESITTIDKIDSGQSDLVRSAQESTHGKIHFILRSSFDLKSEDFDNDYDLVFIDGEHTHKAVKNDFKLATKVTKPDAVIVFDDYRNKHLEVKKYIGALKFNRLIVSTDGWLYKNDLIAEHGDADKVVDGRERGSGQVILYKNGDTSGKILKSQFE